MGAITQEDLRHCLVMQSQDPPRRRRRLGRILLDEERVTEISLAAALAQAHGLRSVDLSQEEIDTDVARSSPGRGDESPRGPLVAVGQRCG